MSNQCNYFFTFCLKIFTIDVIKYKNLYNKYHDIRETHSYVTSRLIANCFTLIENLREFHGKYCGIYGGIVQCIDCR